MDDDSHVGSSPRRATRRERVMAEKKIAPKVPAKVEKKETTKTAAARVSKKRLHHKKAGR